MIPHPIILQWVNGLWRRLVMMAAGGLLLVTATFAFWRIATHNEGVVLEGQLYRSAQLDPVELRKVIEANHIRTVINLRGDNTSAPWYEQEVTLCRTLGIGHVDVRWSAKELPPPHEVIALLNAYRTMPHPILLHCRSGSDRTGLASSIFLIDQENMSLKSASDSLTWEYGHFAIYPYFEMDEFLELYGEGAGKPLAEWVNQDYPSIYARESRESKLHEVLEPLEYFVKDRL